MIRTTRDPITGKKTLKPYKREDNELLSTW